MDGKKIIKILKSKGWEVKRQRGSHVQMAKGSRRTTIPVHGKAGLKAGTLKNTERQTNEKLI